MLNILHQFEAKLPEWLSNSENWNSLYIDYEQPIVERVWRQEGDYRVYLHRIHLIMPGKKAFMHPHAWPSAVRILRGNYKMNTGMAGYDGILSTNYFNEHSKYEMLDPRGTHSVEPIGSYVDSLMVSGPLFAERQDKLQASPLKLNPLSSSRKEEIIEDFKGHMKWVNMASWR